MSLQTQLKELRTQRKNIADAAGAILTKAATEKRDLTGDENQEFERRHGEVDSLKTQIDRMEKQAKLEEQLGSTQRDNRDAGFEDIDAPTSTPGHLATMTPEKRAKVKELQSLEVRSYLLGGGELRGEMQVRRAQLTKEVGSEFRALSAVTANLGATTIPSGFVYTLETALKYYGGIIDWADYIDTDMGNQLPFPSINDTANTGEVITENSQVAGTTGGGSEQDPAYGVINFNAYMLDTGFVLIPVQLLQDSAFNVDTYLQDQMRIRLGRKLNTLCTVGTGSSQPTGVVTAATLGVSAASATAIAYNDLLNLFHSVDPAYRESSPKCGWMFNDSTLLSIKKLVDSNNRPLFIAGGTAEGIQNASPDKLMGKPFAINQDMATIGANSKPIMFGDFSKYKIRRVRAIEMARANERFIDKLQIGFLAYQRYDGNLVDAGTHPIKYLQNAAS